MSVGVEVDALALMLDGVINDQCGRRFNRINVEFLVKRRHYNPPPMMERTVALPDKVAVAEAILELEGNADNAWSFGPLALKAWNHVRRRATCGERIIIISLEAAALLRDGWRPKGWRS